MIQIVLKASSRFREEGIATYEINRQEPAMEPWTAQDSIIAALDYLYGTTDKLVRDRSRELGSVIDEAPSEITEGRWRAEQQVQFLLKKQMTVLAAALCTNMDEKVRTVTT
jgi:nuclear pore complex protein Nup133